MIMMSKHNYSFMLEIFNFVSDDPVMLHILKVRVAFKN